MIVLHAPADSLRALLRRLPRCNGCGVPAEFRLRSGACVSVACPTCADLHPEAKRDELQHAAALRAIVSALAADAEATERAS